MAGASAIETALARLQAAIAALDDAVEQQRHADRRRGDADVELQRLGNDRSRLAQSLDASEARAARLEDVNRDVSRRLVAAMESIRGVIERHS